MPLRFHFGAIRITPGAEAALTVEQAKDLFMRHVRCDWGDMDDEDKAANDRALREGGRLMSQYKLADDCVIIWIITEADRSATTLLLPDEY